VTALLLALLAGIGVHLLVGARLGAARRRAAADASAAGIEQGMDTARKQLRPQGLRGRAREWLVQAGLGDLRPSEFLAVSAILCLVGAVLSFALFGGLLPSVVIGLAAAAVPLHLYRGRRAARLARAQDAWPRLIEEIRVHALTMGRSLPQAVFEAGRRAPTELRPGFEAAEREWLLSFDFARTLDVLRARLADPTADITCETLLVAHEVGGTDLAHRLEALAEDRLADAEGRKDARAKQAGVRFARRFVLVVPAGMAGAGAMIGGGRAAYSTPVGQGIVLVALALVGACWLWAGRYLKLPVPPRAFAASSGAGTTGVTARSIGASAAAVALSVDATDFTDVRATAGTGVPS
jgi:tight adherence protein B